MLHCILQGQNPPLAQSFVAVPWEQSRKWLSVTRATCISVVLVLHHLAVVVAAVTDGGRGCSSAFSRWPLVCTELLGPRLRVIFIMPP